MSLLFTRPGGSIEERWITYALLRDTVQHHLEGGIPSGRFPALHAISEALGRKTAVPAPSLRLEMAEARTLLGRPIADLAISLRTHAILTLSSPLPTLRATSLVTEWGGRLDLPVVSPRVLGDVFGPLVAGLSRVAAAESGLGTVEVIDL